MPNLPIEQPPIEFTDQQREYLERMFRNVGIALNTVYQYPILYDYPENLSVGKVYYFGAAIDATITAEGWWGYTSGGWVSIGI